jgi:putative FmdB family regulatory protein
VPIYEFTCPECGLRFDKRFSKAASTEELPFTACQECGKPAYRQVTAANHKFSHSASQTRGALPPNTGTSDDWNFDRVIGRDAEAKWKVAGQRDAAKQRVIADEKQAGRLVGKSQLVRTADGDGYRPVQESERVEINKRREAAAAVAKAAAAKPKPKDG